MVHLAAHGSQQLSTIARNLRRIMARHGLTYGEVVECCQLDERTIRGLMRGFKRPHARTLRKLADGLGVDVDELFRSDADEAEFDDACNPVVQQVVAEHPHVFAGWTDAEFTELASRFGTGGELNEAGALEAALAMNKKRGVLTRVAVILETTEAELLVDLVELIYRRVAIDR